MNRVNLIGKVTKVKKDGIYELTVQNGKSFEIIVCLFDEKKEKLAKHVTEGRRIGVDGKLAKSKQGEFYIIVEQLDFLDAPKKEERKEERREEQNDEIPF